MIILKALGSGTYVSVMTQKYTHLRLLAQKRIIYLVPLWILGKYHISSNFMLELC